jgi:iron(III) transport system permease protein
MAKGQHTTLPATATLATATWTTLAYSAAGAAVTVVLAIPVALVSFRRSSVPRSVLERSTYVTKALPGVVIALSLVFFATRYAYGLYETSALLVAAYVILNFPLALVCVKASGDHVPRLTDVGARRAAGRCGVARIIPPLPAPGLPPGSAWCSSRR